MLQGVIKYLITERMNEHILMYKLRAVLASGSRPEVVFIES